MIAEFAYHVRTFFLWNIKLTVVSSAHYPKEKSLCSNLSFLCYLCNCLLFYVCFNLLWIPMQIGISSVGDEKQLRNWQRHFGATWIIRASLYTMWASWCGNGLLWINLIASLLLFSGNFAISSCSSSHRACGQNKITLKKTKGKKMKGVEFSVYQLYTNYTIS